MPCGGILREALKYDAIAALLLYDEPMEDGKSVDLGSVNPDMPASGNGVFWKFFGWIDKGAFEVSADAFNTFRVGQYILQQPKPLANMIAGNIDKAQAASGYIFANEF
jgi:calcium binding protein 39